MLSAEALILQRSSVSTSLTEEIFSTGTNNSFILCDLGVLAASNTFCSVCSLYVLIDRIYKLSIHQSVTSSRLEIPSADIFVENIEKISSAFIVGTQQDPSEFLTFLLDHLIQCLSSNKCVPNTKSISSIQHLFGIDIRRNTRCHACCNQSSSSNWESVLAISIDNHTDVDAAIKAFFAEELLNNENSYECNHCQKQTLGSTKFEIAKTSPIIFINLRKFTYDKNLEMVTKIHRFISFPKILNLNSCMNTNIRDFNEETDSTSDFTYELYAVVVHQGQTPNSGHVFSYIRSPDGLWYEANDEVVTQVPLNVVLTEKDAYVLCYVQRSTQSSFHLDKTSIKSSIKSSSTVITSTPINSRLNERQKLDEKFNVVRIHYILDILLCYLCFRSLHYIILVLPKMNRAKKTQFISIQF